MAINTASAATVTSVKIVFFNVSRYRYLYRILSSSSDIIDILGKSDMVT